MNKKTTIVVLAVFVILAVLIGIVLLNKDDGPVMGMTLSSNRVGDLSQYKENGKQPPEDEFIVLEKEFNHYAEKIKNRIPAGNDLFANVHIVERPKGSEFKGSWVRDGIIVKEETMTMLTDKAGILNFLLDGSNLKTGNYVFELYSEGKKIFMYQFKVE